MAERSTHNRLVTGSIPVRATTHNPLVLGSSPGRPTSLPLFTAEEV